MWWKRWPVWAGAAAIFLLGISAGMMIERSRLGASAEKSDDRVAPAAAAGVTPMPSGPSDPSDLSDPRVGGKTSPGALGRSAPPPASPPPSATATTVNAFMDKLVDVSCDKLVGCGVMPAQTKPVCRSMFEDLRVDDAEARIASGRCSFDGSAANRCLALIKDVDCSKVSTDMGDIAALLAGPLISCQESFTCR